MTYNQAIKEAKRMKMSTEYTEEMVKSDFFTEKALKEFKSDFITTVKSLKSMGY